MAVKLLSWNIWCDCHFDKVKEFLAASKADIIGLQEVSLIDPGRDVIGFLRGMGYEYATGPSAEFTDNEGKHHVLNNAVFSKFPILSSKTHELRAGKRPTAVETSIQVDKQPISVFSVHLKHNHQQREEIQDAQVQTLLKILPAERVVVMGDFNATPESHTFQAMSERYVNTDPTFAPTWSMYPEGCPVCRPQKVSTRLDYIFVSSDISFGPFKVGNSEGSDHLPISVSVDA